MPSSANKFSIISFNISGHHFITVLFYRVKIVVSFFTTHILKIKSLKTNNITIFKIPINNIKIKDRIKKKIKCHK